MKRIILQTLCGLLALVSTASAQTTTSGGTSSGGSETTSGTTLAPLKFGNSILTSTPSEATGNSGVGTVVTSSANEFTFGTGGQLMNPIEFNYVMTGPNSATISSPETSTAPASTTNLVFTGPNRGTFSTAAGSNVTTGTFGLNAIPGAAPIENLSARTTVTSGGSTILGFVIGGTMPRRVLIRAVGPGLIPFGVTNPLANPMLSLYRGSELIASNDDWGTLIASPTNSNGVTVGAAPGTSTTPSGATGTTNNGVFIGTLADGSMFTTQLATAEDFVIAGAFSLTAGSRDSAFIVTLPPGAYTVIVTSSTLAMLNASTGPTTGGAISGSANLGMGATDATPTSSSATSGGATIGTTTIATDADTKGSSAVSPGRTSTGATSEVSNSGTTTPSSGAGSGASTTGTTTISTGPTTTSVATSGATGDVLVEVYFIP